ncbi:MAG: ABC transporter ATP-binding protein [Vicinamibacterales bacterium]
MSEPELVIDVQGLVRRFGRTDALNGLDLQVRRGSCYGFFGRNGAGKTTTIKCLLNLLEPTGGSVRLFGLDPARHETAVKARIAYVPDHVAFYPWMTVRETLDYCAAFRARWNTEVERTLLRRLALPERQRTAGLSKGQRTQLALIAAIAADPEMLILDEPTSGLDPIVRREFIETVIGAYQEGGDGNRTVFVSTHLIAEFEGLIDEFTVIDAGRNVLTLDADVARSRYHRLHARYPGDARIPLPDECRVVREQGGEVEAITADASPQLLERLRALPLESLSLEALSLEEIVVSTLRGEAARA